MHDSNASSYDQSLYSIHNRLFFRLFQTGNSLDRQCLKELGISPVHWSVLGALSRPDIKNTGMSFSDLTDYLGISRQSLDNVLKRLEREGIVQRVTASHDKRAKNVALTPLGHQNWEDLQDKFFQFYSQAMHNFVFDDAVALIHLLNKLNDGLKQIKINPSDQDSQ
ncbi:MarR family winged helix-turn-helix transcriptional regulator [Acinetobacter pragensis]|uniref:MarR family transcriptional regulator n=1 Tax=Acinetobacter pragensis TaxID=1806892 RepID=A0A151Y3U0_9GAMM|nr:MarR family transcriptional regulator [Acinetobacter pragensis]KYQ72701.1 MarR family transcriptional regulator [Acinetobacter pragensis]